MRHTFLPALAFLLLGAVPAFGQIDRGQIAGFVKDQTGAVVPGATVTVMHMQTRATRTNVTDTSGYYAFPALAPGAYDVTVELEGFKKAVLTGLTLDAAASIVADVTLETGAIAEAVTVTAEATPLQTDVAIRKTVEAKDIELLSFSGRNPIGVVSLKTGVVGGAFNSRGFDDLGNGGFNINGSRPDENTISIDGAIGVRTRSTGTIIGIQNVDAVQEVQVLTANYMPEYGAPAAGKSGSSPRAAATGTAEADRFTSATSRCRPIRGRVIVVRTRQKTAALRRSITSNGPTPSADRYRVSGSGIGSSSSARRSGSTSFSSTRTRSRCPPRRCAAAISASC